MVQVVEELEVLENLNVPVSGCYTVSPLNGNPGGALLLQLKLYPITVGGGGAGGSSLLQVQQMDQAGG